MLDAPLPDWMGLFLIQDHAEQIAQDGSQSGHDDIVMSLALAAHLALIPRNTGFFTGVNLTLLRHSTDTSDPWRDIWKLWIRAFLSKALWGSLSSYVLIWGWVVGYIRNLSAHFIGKYKCPGRDKPGHLILKLC